MTHINWKVWNTCPKCKKDWGRMFHDIKIIGIYRSKHTCKICGHEWYTQ